MKGYWSHFKRHGKYELIPLAVLFAAVFLIPSILLWVLNDPTDRFGIQYFSLMFLVPGAALLTGAVSAAFDQYSWLQPVVLALSLAGLLLVANAFSSDGKISVQILLIYLVYLLLNFLPAFFLLKYRDKISKK